MISKLAKSTIEKWTEIEGLKPTIEDIVYLNALGLKVENGAEAYTFGAVPRCAFLGDYTFWEPTIAKKLWIDRARTMISNGYFTQLTFTAYALNTPLSELPDLKKVSELNDKVLQFTSEVLNNFTESQIFAAISYAISGNDWRVGEEYTQQQKDDFNKIYDIPEEAYSNSKQLLAEALTYGLSDGIKDFTIKELERMIIVAAMHEGIDVLKNEHTQNAAKFYACAGKIHARLIEEKANKDGTES